MGKISRNSGFTLIEMLVTTALIGLLSIGLSSTFFATVRGSARAKLEAELRSQGDSITTTLERNLRFATSFPTCSSATNPATITYKVLNKSNQLEDQTLAFTYGNAGAISYTRMVNGVPATDSLINSTQTTGITVSNLAVTCQLDPGGITGYVDITFDLTAARNGVSSLQTFSTRAAMRNLK